MTAMRVVFVQTYPTYHDLLTKDAWLALENRDRWMPGVLAQMGHEVELWAGAEGEGEALSHLDGFGDYRIRFFPAAGGRRTKFHRSNALVAAAAASGADLFVLKGVDGGIGTHLVRSYLIPAGRPFAFVIGGKYYAPEVPGARIVFYETDAQRRLLERPGPRFWRRRVRPERLIRLPKSIDIDRFRPMPGVERTWDLICVGRLIPHYKNYDALGRLSEVARVAVVGGGPEAERLRAKYPAVTWLGPVPNRDLPELLNRAHLFLHPSRRDFYPRVLAEAAACGLPAVAFARSVADDVLPPTRGLRVSETDYVRPILDLLHDEARRREMGRNSRAYAEAEVGRHSSRAALEEMLRRLGNRPSAARIVSDATRSPYWSQADANG